MSTSPSDRKQSFRSLKDKWAGNYIVYTKDPISEIWNTLQYFTHYEYLKKFLSRRTDNSPFQGKNWIIVNRPHTLVPLKEENIPDKIILLQNLIKQSCDFYKASISLPLLSKPILLFYSYESLAQFLFQSTYNENNEKYLHGVTYHPEDSTVEIKKKGLFQNFHYSHSSDVLRPQSFKLLDIISCGSINPIELETYSGKIYNHNIQSTLEENFSITELDREFLFVYCLSILSRYRIVEWANILDGVKVKNLDTHVGLWIKRYLNAIELIFPLLILNELRKEKCYFYEPARLMADEWENYNDKTL